MVSADLDGDHTPDLAIGTRSGPLGYTVEVQFSSRIPSAFLRVASPGAGIRLIIYDVNHDNDPDVVVQAATSLIPLAIWLGDGRGHFRQCDPWRCLPVRMDSSAHVASDQDSHEQTGILTETNFNPAALPAVCSATNPVRQDFVTDTIHFPAPSAFDRRNPGRSPPLFS